MRIFDSRDEAVRRVALIVLLITAGGCTVPVNWFGPQPVPTPRPTMWESDTRAGAKAFEEGRLADAEHSLEQARRQAEAPGRNNDLQLAASLVNLAVVQQAQGNIGAAIELQKEALAIREQVRGREHVEVATSLNSLAALYSLQDDYATAEPLLKRALAIRQQALGPDNEYTAQSLNNLALLYAAQERYAEAEPLYQQAVAAFEKQSDRADLATTLENYAALLEDAGRHQEAERVTTQARAIRATLSAQ